MGKENSDLTRRTALTASAALMLGACAATQQASVGQGSGGQASGGQTSVANARGERRLAPQTTWSLPPAQAPMQEGLLNVEGAKLWYWDTGGDGVPIVMLHAATGSAAGWGYQQPVFAAAGYRVIAYSRRGHYRSEVDPQAGGGGSTADLQSLVDHLGLERFVLLGTALGGFTALDYAIAHPERLRALVLTCTMGGVQDPDYARQTAALTPPPWNDMPASFRELGPSYRAMYPEGVAAWEAIERASLSGAQMVRQRLLNTITWDAVAAVKTPTLFITGDADLYMPPARARAFTGHMTNAELLIATDAGHSAYWEQPEAFNREVLAFLARLP